MPSPYYPDHHSSFDEPGELGQHLHQHAALYVHQLDGGRLLPQCFYRAVLGH